MTTVQLAETNTTVINIRGLDRKKMMYNLLIIFFNNNSVMEGLTGDLGLSQYHRFFLVSEKSPILEPLPALFGLSESFKNDVFVSENVIKIHRKVSF